MEHFEAKMSSKGQLTVPVSVREQLRLKAGDVVDFYVDERTRAVEIIARNKPLSELFGMLGKEGTRSEPLSQAQLDDAIADHLAEDDKRISRDRNERREFEEWKRARKADAAE